MDAVQRLDGNGLNFNKILEKFSLRYSLAP
jgi:hypothetical protein